MNTKAKGDIAEEKAAQFLIEQGYRILERNFSCKLGEIDIIAAEGEVIHFVEVKSGRGFEPIYNISATKLRKIIKTAHAYLKLKNMDSAFVIDAVTLKDGHLEYHENLTL